MRKRLTALLCSLGLAASVVLAPAANAGIPPCAYSNYFGPPPAYKQIKPTPVVKIRNSSQYGRAWCVGFGKYVWPKEWVSNQRLYEKLTGN